MSICLYDRKRKKGGMACFLFPSIRHKNQTTAIYGNVATVTLIRMMYQTGSKRRHLEAQILGGAFNPEFSTVDIGRQNSRVARKIVLREKISVTSEDTGGQRGRKIVFNTENNELAVIKVDRLRQSDWYPYKNNR